ncbi:hypothetical protein MLD52_04065 [Puniceicoccaceae bacterium K14]|nr:hypothetical protein [Puniceicoccaceae bacterium K14]
MQTHEIRNVWSTTKTKLKQKWANLNKHDPKQPPGSLNQIVGSIQRLAATLAKATGKAFRDGKGSK